MKAINLTDDQKELLKRALRNELIRKSNAYDYHYLEFQHDCIIIAGQNGLGGDFIDELKQMR